MRKLLIASALLLTFSVQASMPLVSDDDFIARNLSLSDFLHEFSSHYHVPVIQHPEIASDDRLLSLHVPAGSSVEDTFISVLNAYGYDLCPTSVYSVVPAKKYNWRGPLEVDSDAKGGVFSHSVKMGDYQGEYRFYPSACE